MFSQAFGENHSLEMPCWIRQADDAHLTARPRPALGARDDGRRNTACRRSSLDRARKFRPRLYTQFFEHGGIVVKRMTGQKKTYRFVFATQSFGGEPRFERRQRDLLANRPATEQFTLPDCSRVVATLRAAKYCIDSCEDPRAIFLE